MAELFEINIVFKVYRDFKRQPAFLIQPAAKLFFARDVVVNNIFPLST